jgi:hypothetical protein
MNMIQSSTNRASEATLLLLPKIVSVHGRWGREVSLKLALNVAKDDVEILHEGPFLSGVRQVWYVIPLPLRWLYSLVRAGTRFLRSMHSLYTLFEECVKARGRGLFVGRERKSATKLQPEECDCLRIRPHVVMELMILASVSLGHHVLPPRHFKHHFRS